MSKVNNKQLWSDCLETIKVSVSPAIYSTWFSQTHIVRVDEANGRYLVEIGCPSTYIKSTIENRYFGLVQDSLSKSLGKPCDVVVVIKEPPKTKKDVKDTKTPLFDQNEKNDISQGIIKAGLRQNFTFNNYAVSSSNQMAWAAAEAVSESPGTAYNPLFIWGGVGYGKTHLMNSVGCEIIKKDQNGKVYFCTGEEFTNDIVEGIRNKTTANFRTKYRKLNTLMIDDIQFIAGKDAIQEEFFHTFNALVNSGSQIIMTSDKPPGEIAKLEERLRSRFEAGLTVDIAPPGFELRCAIVQIKAKERDVDIPMDMVQLIAGNIDSARKIEGVIINIHSQMKHNKNTAIDEELIKPILGKGIDVDRYAKRSTPNEMIDAVCKHYSIGKRKILSPSRVISYALPRQVLMYLLRTHLNLSLEEVGRIVGRDHTTVMHGVDKITKLASSDVGIREDIKGIKSLL